MQEPNKQTQGKEVPVDNVVKKQTQHTIVAQDVSLTEYDCTVKSQKTKQGKSATKRSLNNLDV